MQSLDNQRFKGKKGQWSFRSLMSEHDHIKKKFHHFFSWPWYSYWFYYFLICTHFYALEKMMVIEWFNTRLHTEYQMPQVKIFSRTAKMSTTLILFHSTPPHWFSSLGFMYTKNEVCHEICPPIELSHLWSKSNDMLLIFSMSTIGCRSA